MMRKKLVSLFIILFLVLCFFIFLKPKLLAELSFSTAVYDKSGTLLRLTLSKDEKYRMWVPLNKISPHLINAVILHEDQFFYWHPGINPLSLIRSAIQTYFTGSRRVGASTITMQLARLLYKINSKNILGKLNQILRAIQIELFYSKDEILETYLNMAPYGSNIEGVGAASLIYFNKKAEQLTVLEAVTLSLIPQNPSKLLSTKDKNNKLLISMRNRLFENWLGKHEKDKKLKNQLKLPFKINHINQLPFEAPHFVDSILSKYPNVRHIVTTLDIKLQKLIERHTRQYIERKKNVGITNASVLLVNYKTMEIEASLGSADFFNNEIHGQVNGTEAKRSPGSTLKPFIYALAVDQGLIHYMTMLKDAPTRFGLYNPENFDGDFKGPITVKDALILSRNVPALHVASRLKPDLYDFLISANVKDLRDKLFYGLSLILGGAEITIKDIVQLYAILANAGILKPIKEILDNDGKIISYKEFNRNNLLSRESCFMILNILKDNPRPKQKFKKEWTRDQVSVAWKTGTSIAFRDAWSVGIFGPYIIAVWIGNFDGEGNPAFVGIEAAAPLMFEIVDSVMALKPKLKYVFSEGEKRTEKIKQIDVCAVSGLLPGKYCKKAIPTWFIPGKSPINVCNIHREVLINAETGLRSCGFETNKIRTEVYEFWPTDLLELFKKAGIPRRSPPRYSPQCSKKILISKGVRPEIISPIKSISYTIRNMTDKAENIPLMSVTDADVNMIYWFINESFVGKVKPENTFFWKPSHPGNYIIRVVDEFGRSDVRDITITFGE